MGRRPLSPDSETVRDGFALPKADLDAYNKVCDDSGIPRSDAYRAWVETIGQLGPEFLQDMQKTAKLQGLKPGEVIAQWLAVGAKASGFDIQAPPLPEPVNARVLIEQKRKEINRAIRLVLRDCLAELRRKLQAVASKHNEPLQT